MATDSKSRLNIKKKHNITFISPRIYKGSCIANFSEKKLGWQFQVLSFCLYPMIVAGSCLLQISLSF